MSRTLIFVIRVFIGGLIGSLPDHWSRDFTDPCDIRIIVDSYLLISKSIYLQWHLSQPNLLRKPLPS